MIGFFLCVNLEDIRLEMGKIFLNVGEFFIRNKRNKDKLIIINIMVIYYFSF